MSDNLLYLNGKTVTVCFCWCSEAKETINQIGKLPNSRRKTERPLFRHILWTKNSINLFRSPNHKEPLLLDFQKAAAFFRHLHWYSWASFFEDRFTKNRFLINTFICIYRFSLPIITKVLRTITTFRYEKFQYTGSLCKESEDPEFSMANLRFEICHRRNGSAWLFTTLLRDEL